MVWERVVEVTGIVSCSLSEQMRLRGHRRVLSVPRRHMTAVRVIEMYPRDVRLVKNEVDGLTNTYRIIRS